MTDPQAVWDELVRHLIAASDEEIEAADVKRETMLREDLDLGSLQAITLIMDLEENFGIQVDDEKLEALRNVGDVYDLVQERLQEAQPGAAS